MGNSGSGVEFGVQCEPVESSVCQATLWIHRIGPTTLLAVGTVGNIVNIVVLSRKKIRATPCFLLVFLAVFDILCLWSLFLQTSLSRGFDINLKAVSQLYCKVHTWMSVWSGSASLWTVAIFTVERMMFALFPHNTAVHLNRNKSIIVMWVVLIPIGAMLAVILGGNGSTGNDVTNSTTNQTASQCGTVGFSDGPGFANWQIVILLLCQMMPFFIVISGNVTLLVHLYRRRRTGTSTDSQTVLLLLVTGLMLCTLGPFGIFVVTVQAVSGVVDLSGSTQELLFSMVYFLIMCNHSLNFFCYVWKGTLFNRECKAIWQELKTFRPFQNNRVN